MLCIGHHIQCHTPDWWLGGKHNHYTFCPFERQWHYFNGSTIQCWDSGDSMLPGIHTMVFGVSCPATPTSESIVSIASIFTNRDQKKDLQKPPVCQLRDAGRMVCYTGQSSLQRVTPRQMERFGMGEALCIPFSAPVTKSNHCLENPWRHLSVCPVHGHWIRCLW